MMVTVMSHADQARIEAAAIKLELDHHIEAVAHRSNSTGKHEIRVPLNAVRVAKEAIAEVWEKVNV